MIVLFTSCNKEDKDYNYTYTSEELNLTEVIQQNSSNIEKSDLMNLYGKETIIVQSILNTDLKIPDNLDLSELEEFITKNLNKLSGNLKFTFNGVTELEFEINNGVIEESIETSETKNVGKSSKLEQFSIELEEYPKADECSFEGVRQCANKAMYSKSTVSKLVCAFSFWYCYPEEAATCVENNCVRN